MKPEHAIRGERLSLQPLQLAGNDEDTYLSWLRDPLVTKFLEARLTDYTCDKLRAYVKGENANHDSVLFAVQTEPEGSFIGTIKLSRIRQEHRHCEVALMIGNRAAWGKGYGTEAIKLACTYAFDSLGLHKVAAGLYHTNKGSERAFQKAGFTLEGRLIDDRWDGERWVDKLVYGLINPKELPKETTANNDSGGAE